MEQINDILDLSKLFCTFTSPTGLDDTINVINSRYNILFGKIFILESPQSDELICTYNIDSNNTHHQNSLLTNTILLHRKKETNTLYTINALNILVRSLNNGIADKNYVVEWNNYKNSILLTDGSNLRKLNTTIHKIVALK